MNHYVVYCPPLSTQTLYYSFTAMPFRCCYWCLLPWTKKTARHTCSLDWIRINNNNKNKWKHSIAKWKISTFKFITIFVFYANCFHVILLNWMPFNLRWRKSNSSWMDQFVLLKANVCKASFKLPSECIGWMVASVRLTICWSAWFKLGKNHMVNKQWQIDIWK